jgi:hypothetical protein
VKLIIGCPIKDRAWCLPEWFAATEGQPLDGVEVEYLFVLSTDTSDNTEAVLKEHTDNVLYDISPGRSQRDIDGHVWGAMHHYQYMCHLRNGLLREAADMGADYFFSLDSDIILPPEGLKRVLDYARLHRGVTAPAVSMSWGQTAWNTMSWVDRNHPNMAERTLVPPVTGQRDVVMAAMLLDRSALDQCSWAPHQQGEDIGFCVQAWKLRVPLWWMAEVRCQHLMRRYA